MWIEVGLLTKLHREKKGKRMDVRMHACMYEFYIYGPLSQSVSLK